MNESIGSNDCIACLKMDGLVRRETSVSIIEGHRASGKSNE